VFLLTALFKLMLTNFFYLYF